MAIEIVYRGQDPKKEKINGDCKSCSTKVNMLVEDLISEYGTNLRWVCPVCHVENWTYGTGHWPSPFVASMSEQFGR